MNSSNKKEILFLSFILLALSVLFYHNTISLFPAYMHSWTQSDRYALALGFLNNGFDFFHPETFNQMTVDGITRVDFPINDYIVAIFMKLFGTTAPIVFRIYTLLVSIMGLIYLYLLAKKITASEIKSLLVVLFVFLSPIYMYYQDGFIPTIPALSFTFIAYYYYFSYTNTESKKQFCLAILFFALAALVRMPFIIFLMSVFVQQAFLILKEKRIKKFEFLIFCIGFGMIIGYFFYNLHLYRIYGTIFLDHLTSPKNFSELYEILTEMYQHWCFHYFTIWHYLLLIIVLALALLALLKRRMIEEENKKYWFQLFITFCGTSVYFLAMAKQYYDHDYYFLDSFFTPIVLLFLFSIRSIRVEKYVFKIVFAAGTLVFAVLAGISAQKIQDERYRTFSWDRVETTRQNFIGSEEFLDKNGIPKDAKMLVIDAYSYNVPLILMNRKGYTVHQTVRDDAAFAMFWAKWDYVVIQDVFLVSDVLKYYPIVSYMIEPIAGNGKITVYKKSKEFRKKPVSYLLNINKKSVVYTTRIDFDSRTEKDHFGDVWNIKNVPEYETKAAVLDSATEYGVAFTIEAKELKEAGSLTLSVSSDILLKGDSEIQLVAIITNGEKTKGFQSHKLRDYYKPSDAIQNGQFYFALQQFTNEKDVLSVYFWNPGKNAMLYDNFEIVIYKNQE